MSPKWRYILGTVTIVTIIGGTIYAVKKSKDLEKAEENAISVDEALEMVRKRKEENAEELGAEELANLVLKQTEAVEKISVELEEVTVEIVAENEELITKQTTAAAIEGAYPLEDNNPMNVRRAGDVIDEEDQYPHLNEDTEGPTLTVTPLSDFMYYEEGIDAKEDKTLRFNPNSVEAKHQFIRMELAEWQPNQDVYRILLQLFEIPFIPTNDGDDLLRTQVIDYKVQFFGWGSKWNKEVSYADIVLHYARVAEFNCGDTVAYWTEHFLYAAGFEWDFTSQEMDTLILRLNQHSHFNERTETFGLFGINRQYMDEAIKIANRNLDRSVTYEIEFNEFLKACMNEELKR